MRAQTVQNPILAVYSGDAPVAAMSQVTTLGVYDGDPTSKSARSSQFAALAVVETAPAIPSLFPVSSQFGVLAVYNEGVTGDYSLRAWTFTLDGHPMYVLHLGVLGTYIYDMFSERWSQWGTEGYIGWNAEQGIPWNGRIIAGDSQDGTIWQVDTDTQLDMGFKPIRHISTAIIGVSGTQFASLDKINIVASVGYTIGADPLMAVRISDDYGRTWTELTDVDVTLLNGDYTQQLSFRSLGTFGNPGRVIEVNDFGGPVRIDYATMDLSRGSDS